KEMERRSVTPRRRRLEEVPGMPQRNLAQPVVLATGHERGVVVGIVGAQDRGRCRLADREPAPQVIEVLHATKVPANKLLEVELAVQDHDVAIDPAREQVMGDVERTHPARTSVKEVETGGANKAETVLEDVCRSGLQEAAPHTDVDEQVDLLRPEAG